VHFRENFDGTYNFDFYILFVRKKLQDSFTADAENTHRREVFIFVVCFDANLPNVFGSVLVIACSLSFQFLQAS
jgi:hypothetical protein